ncbi:NADPH-cytochrome P450 reductase [Lophiotrema nucula]|uniref:NADPH--cytochrome P450 reductase n=1 Tax=Lophiotrema nucula TaxID=690887 RepID=A0A6A5Z4B1_9PLEO|nr:NADPH-cytochrome P450 reductase [Lophiotrema nucula]
MDILSALQIPPTLHPLLSAVQPSSRADAVAALLFLLSALGYLTRGRLWEKPDPYYHIYFERPQLVDGASAINAASTRNVAQRLEEDNCDVVIFWGSQSGTSERFAEALGRESYSRFGINTLVADLSDFDADSIALIPTNKLAMFLISTYGEGDPSDNTAAFWDWIRKVEGESRTLKGLRYLAFGLGNSNYKYYNRVLDVIADSLDEAGATALLPRGKADDANGGTEDDFQSWKDSVFALFRTLGHQEKAVIYEPTINVLLSEGAEANQDEHSVSIHYQRSATTSAIVPLPIKNARELFSAGDRNCVHMELDLGAHAEVQYKTGDHVGIWPVNPEDEINRLLEALGLRDQRYHSLLLSAVEKATKPRVPSPTTLEQAFRHYLEICGPVSRKRLLDIAQFAPTQEAKATLLALGEDRERYKQLTANTHVTLARLLQLVCPNEPWTSLPLSFVIETLLPLQPRYYSISSSSIISPRRIAVTALVVNKAIPSESGPESIIHGLASNYLLSATNLPTTSSVTAPVYAHKAFKDGLETRTVLAHIRKSKFKLPITSSTPLILISAGTGFAPFRAFLAERAKLHAIGKPVGKILLFFGCRHPDTDYIYHSELNKMQESLGDKLEIVTAFSRQEGAKKVYVQDRVAECSAQVLDMLDAGANMYICGKASMAREVDMKLEEAAMSVKGFQEKDVKAWTDALKRRGKWKADVWG